MIENEIPHLTETPEGLTLTGNGLSMRGDFSKMKKRLKAGIVGTEHLVRAARFKGETGLLLVDATAGLGEDSVLLAAAGFRVLLMERNETIAALLKDALKRGAEDPELTETVSRMEVLEGDSTELLPKLSVTPDVVYLDPMFPERKKSALIKKKFQLIHGLEKPCEDEDLLFDAALSASPRKIVVKRPEKGPFLAGRKPDYSLPGKAIRYDVYLYVKENGKD